MSRAVYRQLKLLVRRQRAPFVEVQRARIVLLARDGVGTGEIARAVGCTDRSVRKWKARFMAEPTPKGLQDAPRTGRPATVPIWVRCKLVQLACNRRGKKVAFRDVWTHGALSRELEGLKHLRARKYGSTIIVESGPKSTAFKHFRLRRDTVHLWMLDMAGHGQRWERTPFRAQLQELVDTVMDAFPWTLADVIQNSERKHQS